MAFNLNNLDKLSGEGTPVVRKLWGYTDTSVTIATLSAANYFDDVASRLTIGDSFYLRGSDGVDQVNVTAVSPHVTVAVDPSVAPGSIGTTELTDNGVTSAKLALNVLQYATVAITAAQFNGMYAAPKLLVAAPGANKIIVLDKVDLLMTYGAAAYAAGGVAAVQYDSTVNGGGVIASTTLAAATFQATASTGFMFNTGVVAQTFSTCVNKGLYLSNITAAFTTGDSTFVAHVYYKIIATA